MAKPAPMVEPPKVEPAPQVEPATAVAAKPRAAPVVDIAPIVEAAVADPPPTIDEDDRVFVPPPRSHDHVTTAKQNYTTTPASMTSREGERRIAPLSIDKLRSTHTIIFESLAAVIIGPAQKDICQKLLPCLKERSYISYGEIQRHILLTNENTLFVYADSTDPSPLYSLPFKGLRPQLEDALHKDINSTTISPGTEGTNMRSHSLETILMYDENRKIRYQFAFDTSREPSVVGVSERFIAAIISSSHGTEK